MKTPIRIILLLFIFWSIASPCSHAIIRTRTDHSQAVIVPKSYSPTLKERISAFIIKKKLGITSPDNTRQQLTKTQKIVNIIIFTVAGLAAVYYLQGTLWLLLVGLFALFLYFKHKNHKNKSRKPKNNPLPETPLPNNGRPVIVNTNTFARKSRRSFLSGLLSVVGAFGFIFLLTIFELDSIILLLGFVGLAVIAAVSFSLSISNSIKSIKNKEDDKDESILWMVLSILFLLPIFAFFLALITTI